MRYLFGFICVLALSAVFVACGGEEAGCAEPAGDATGVWEMTATPIEDTCDGEPGAPYTFWVTIMQEGNSLTAQTPEGTFPGTICGDRIQMSGSYPEDNGTTTANLELTVLADGNSVEGSDTWNWTNGVQNCGGSESLVGVRADTRHSEVCEPLCAKVSECSIPWNCVQSCYFVLADSARTSAECEDAMADLYACVAGLSCEQIGDFLTGGDPCEANDFVRSVCL
jgi:hypothetical protein